MAVTAKFIADFDQFVSSTKTAETSLKSLETQGAKVGSTMDAVKGGAGQLAAAFGVAFSAAAVVGFGKELLRMGDEIVRVADRTGLTTKEVQQLSYVAGQSGNSIDELTGAIGQMQNRLASGDKNAISSVHDLGLNLQALSALSPADQLEQIATAIAKIPDPAERTRIAMDLFGKAGTAILPTLTSQFAALRAEAPVMSDATVKALDRAGDQLARFGTQLKVWAAESYNYAGKAFDAIVKAAYNAIAAFSEMTVAVVTSIEKLPGMSKVLTALGVDTAAMTANAQWFRDAAKGMGVEVEVSTPKVTALGGALKETAEQTAAATRAADAFRAAMEELTAVGNGWRHTVDEIDGSVVEAIKFYLQAGASQSALATAYGVTATQIKAVATAMSEELAMAKAVDDFITMASKNQAALDAKAMASIEAKTAALRAATAEAIAFNEAFLASELKAALAQDAINAAGGVDPSVIGSGQRGPGVNQGGQVPFGGLNTGAGTSFPSGLHPLRAGGGPGMAGTSYIVGEKGPELYTPGANGFFTPSGGGGGTVVNHFYVNGTAQDIAKQTAETIKRTLMQSTKLVPS